MSEYDFPIMVILKTEKENVQVRRLSADINANKSMSDYFQKGDENLIEKTKVEYCPDYKTESDEVFIISDFVLPDRIKEAVEQPLSVEIYSPSKRPMSEDIRAIFMKTSTGRIAFRHLDNHMYLANKKRIVFSSNTFTEETGDGFILSDCIDCLFSKGELLFRSFHYAKQIMDLSDYFKIATDEDVNEFLGLVSLESHNMDSFIKNLNQSTRRWIYKINKTRILEKYSPEQICDKAVGLGINIKIDNGKIMIPNDNKEQKSFFTFLDEGIYKGSLSESTYITNSKRKLD